VPLEKALYGIASIFEWLNGSGSNRWQLVSKAAKVTSLSPGRDTGQINEQTATHTKDFKMVSAASLVLTLNIKELRRG